MLYPRREFPPGTFENRDVGFYCVYQFTVSFSNNLENIVTVGSRYMIGSFHRLVPLVKQVCLGLVQAIDPILKGVSGFSLNGGDLLGHHFTALWNLNCE